MASSKTTIENLQSGDSDRSGAAERGLRERLRWVILFGIIEAVLLVIALFLDTLANMFVGLSSEVLRISAGIVGALFVIAGVIGGLLLLSVYAYFAIRAALRDGTTSY